jgi:hypothetical protein
MVRVAGFDANGLVGDAMLATIDIECASTGSSSLKLTVVDLLDATPGAPAQIEAGIQNGSVTCTKPSASDSDSTSAESAVAEVQEQPAASLPTAGGLPAVSTERDSSWTYLLIGAAALALFGGGALTLKKIRR